MNRIPSIEQKLLSNVLCSLETKCWEWQGTKGKGGYGYLSSARAHRVSYELYHKEPAGKLFVCHECDNPGCVNPEHLFLGTALINKIDCVVKGRGANGELNGYSTLTEEIVIKIREGYAYKNKSVSMLSSEFNTEKSNIRAIVYGESWRHTSGPISPKPGFGKKLTANKAKTIYRLCKEGRLTVSEVAKKYGIAKSNVRGIANGDTWAHATGAKPGEIDLVERKRKKIAKKREMREAGLREYAQNHEMRVNEAVVLSVRHLRNDLNWPIEKVSAQLGVTTSQVADISLGNSWSDIGGTIRATGPGKKGQHLGSDRSNAKMNEDKVKELRALHSQGWKNAQLQARFNLSAATVSNIANRKTWKHVD